MSTSPCPCCEWPCRGPVLFCPRCGSDVRKPSSWERLLLLLNVLRTLFRNHVRHKRRTLTRVVKRVLTDRPQLQSSCERPLVWLAQDAAGLVRADLDLPHSLDVARRVLEFLPPDKLGGLRGRVDRLGEFVDALTAADDAWRDGKVPDQSRVQAWFHAAARKARLAEPDALARVYATPEWWPRVARALDPEAFHQARWLLLTARGERHLKKQKFPSAQQHFTAALDDNPRGIRALEGLTQVHLATGHQAEALRYGRWAIRLGTRDPITFCTVSRLLSLSNRATPAELEEALWAARRAVELAPLDACWEVLALAQWRQHNLPAAIAAVREAIRFNPDHRGYARRLAQFCEELPWPPVASGPRPAEAVTAKPPPPPPAEHDEIDFDMRLDEEESLRMDTRPVESDSEIDLGADEHLPARAARIDDDDLAENDVDPSPVEKQVPPKPPAPPETGP